MFPPRHTFAGPLVVAPVTVTLMKLSTSTLPLPSGVDDNTALIGTPASQIRLTVALLKAFGCVIDEPSVELRTCVEPNSLIAFCATAF